MRTLIDVPAFFNRVTKIAYFLTQGWGCLGLSGCSWLFQKYPCYWPSLTFALHDWFNFHAIYTALSCPSSVCVELFTSFVHVFFHSSCLHDFLDAFREVELRQRFFPHLSKSASMSFRVTLCRFPICLDCTKHQLSSIPRPARKAGKNGELFQVPCFDSSTCSTEANLQHIRRKHFVAQVLYNTETPRPLCLCVL